ncbi:ABC transporter substrate-binding protein [Parasphingopyxis sp.]|uniref:ABC transporter substrate-binding protein n=1 Tax=Parasphingopyxis sp. TaxID=1920299 RepID=UPI0026022FD7|nr:ABC transporter substrate-binding protein [Parasphingopyxis sp.]
MIRASLPILALLFAACTDGEDAGPIRADFIGEPTPFDQPLAALPSPSDALLLSATAQGLVRFDEEGQIEPALAQRWIVLDEGETYVFRLNAMTWDDGTAVTARQIVQQLRNAQRNSRLAPLLADIEAIEAVTPQVIEINLARPQLDFLQLLAAPELAIRVENIGLGPFVIADGYEPDGEMVLLAPRREPPEDVDGEIVAPPPISPAETVELRFRGAAEAVARFENGQTDVVLGGGWSTLIYADVVEPNSARLQLDPVDGLFGLAIVEETGFLADPRNREILSLAIDRGQLAGYFGANRAEARLAIVSADAQGMAVPVNPPWANSTMDLRRAFAITAVAEWQAENGDIAPLRIALPDDAGSRIVFAVLRTNWAAVGVPVERVEWAADADLRLIDRVAATESATWFLEQFRCNQGLPCSEDYADLLDQIQEVRSDRVRAIRISEAATELQSVTPFIPLLRPVRWSLVSPRISGFMANRFASHPLDRLAPPS